MNAERKQYFSVVINVDLLHAFVFFRILASGSDDHRAILWDPFRNRKIHTIETGHLNNIFSVQVAEVLFFLIA